MLTTSITLGTALLVWNAAAGTADSDGIEVRRGGSSWIQTDVHEGATPARRKVVRSGPVRCVQTKSPYAGGYATEAQFRDAGPAGPGSGGWVIRRCSDGTLDQAWVPEREPDTAVAPAQLARRATNRLLLPLPTPRFNPSRPSSAGPSTLVGVPTWFWIDSWRPVRQGTRAGGVWAEVLATPVEATWFPGDGSAPIRCRPSADGDRSSCEHVYARSSAAEADNAYRAHVVTTWRVTWRGSGGRSGALPPMQREATFSIAVAERQTVVTVGGDR